MAAMSADADPVVVVLHNRMTEAEYDAERGRLRDLYGESSAEAAAKRDQAMALLFARSNWTQEELAAKEGKSPQYIARRLKFGQFLNFSPIGESAEKLPPNLTEGRFRGYWAKTNKADNDRKRYLDVAAAITAGTGKLPGMPAGTDTKFGHKVVEAFGDGKYHDVQAIHDAFPDETPERIDGVLDRMQRLGTFGVKCEERKHGRAMQVRIFPRANRAINVSEIKEKLAPLIKGLVEEGRKSTVTMSPGTVARLAALLQRHLDEWSE
jgi:transcriptional regulator with XRE-family HTH domain